MPRRGGRRGLDFQFFDVGRIVPNRLADLIGREFIGQLAPVESRAADADHGAKLLDRD